MTSDQIDEMSPDELRRALRDRGLHDGHRRARITIAAAIVTTILAGFGLWDRADRMFGYPRTIEAGIGNNTREIALVAAHASALDSRVGKIEDAASDFKVLRFQLSEMKVKLDKIGDKMGVQ